jgi:predicted PurR-regulated permease PerM
MIWVIVATLVIQQIENSLLVPRIMRKAVGINPFVSLLSIFAFSSLFGIAGALMAIPMAAHPAPV